MNFNQPYEKLPKAGHITYFNDAEANRRSFSSKKRRRPKVDEDLNQNINKNVNNNSSNNSEDNNHSEELLAEKEDTKRKMKNIRRNKTPKIKNPNSKKARKSNGAPNVEGNPNKNKIMKTNPKLRSQNNLYDDHNVDSQSQNKNDDLGEALNNKDIDPNAPIDISTQLNGELDALSITNLAKQNHGALNDENDDLTASNDDDDGPGDLNDEDNGSGALNDDDDRPGALDVEDDNHNASNEETNDPHVFNEHQTLGDEY